MDRLKWVWVLVVIIIILNLGVLYLLNFRVSSRLEKAVSKQAETAYPSNSIVEDSPADPSLTTDSDNKICPIACTNEIKNLKKIVVKITPQVIKEIETKTVEASTASAAGDVKEYSIHIGSGSTKSDSWEDIGGLNAYINTDNYPQIQSVVFEASLRIPTANGTVYARIYNKTDSAPIYSSEVSTNSDNSTFLQSKSFSLASGNKLYIVQMKTTMKYESLLDIARIKIITK